MRIEPNRGAAGLNDPGDRAGVDRVVADDVVGVQFAGGFCGRGIAQIRRNSGPWVMPAASSQRSSARTGKLACPVRNADLGTLALSITFREGQGDAQTVLPPLKIGDLDAREFSATKRARKAESNNARSRSPGRSSTIGLTISRRITILAASFGLGPWPACFASLSRPARVSVTCAVVVGDAHPAR